MTDQDGFHKDGNDRFATILRISSRFHQSTALDGEADPVKSQDFSSPLPSRLFLFGAGQRPHGLKDKAPLRSGNAITADLVRKYYDAHFPFGGGSRKCLGADFKMLEARLLLAAIVKNVELNLTSESFVEAEETVTLYPEDGLPMAIRNR